MKNKTEAPLLHEAACAEILTLFPDLPAHAIESFLLVCPAYPLKNPSECLTDLRKLSAKSGRNAGKAVDIYNGEFEADMLSAYTETNRDAVCDEILRIMATYREQAASPAGVDTPGGLEHMGDVWRLFGSWEKLLKKDSKP